MKPFHDETPYLWLLFQQPHLRKTVNTVIHLSKDKGLLWADGSQLPTKTDRQLCGFLSQSLLINWPHLIVMGGYFELELLALLDWNTQLKV